jgi:hypothetical protein
MMCNAMSDAAAHARARGATPSRQARG